jgi:phosphotriesterase-related protein
MLVKDNIILGDINEAVSELLHYKMAGGKSLVDCALPGTGRDPVGLAKISRATGINIICSSGWYVAPTHPPYVRSSSIDELCARIVRELTVSIGTTGIRAGAIKVALSGTPNEPFSNEEEKTLRAAARAQAKTGAPLNIHPNYAGKHWHTYLEILEEEGANLRKCCLNHMEMYLPDIDYQKSLLQRGVFVSYDQFGHEQYMDSIAPGWGFKPDSARVEGLLELLRAGHAHNIMLANEVAFKCCYKKYGGYGYSHVLENIAPELRFKGVKQEQIDTMLIENPKEFLSY